MIGVQRFWSTVVVTLAVVSLAMAGEKKFSQEFTVSPGGTLTVKTDVGSVRVTGSASGQVAVKAQMRGSESDLEAFEVTADQSGNDVTVTGKLKKKFWGHYDIDVVFTIAVPHQYNVRPSTSGGDIEVRSLAGTVSGATSGGNIKAEEIDGEVKLSTSGGDAMARKVTGHTMVTTSGGNVEVSDVKGDVEATTSGGDVLVRDIDGKVKAGTSGGDVRVSVRGANRGVEAMTSGGDVEVLVDPTVGADIDASTSGGDVVCDLPVTVQGKISESRVKGTVNGGGPLIKAYTSGGDVMIRKLK